MRATIRATIAPLLSEARASAAQVSQLLRGHQAEILDRSGNWLHLRGADGYTGWCHTGYLSLANAPDTIPIHAVWQTERRMSLGCTVRRATDPPIALPLGALLDPDEFVVSGLSMNHRGRARYFAQDPHLLTQRTQELFAGSPYQWGGVTPWGADCSGVVQTMFALHGVQLLRDAWQQAEYGTDAPADLISLRPSDLLFFSDRDDNRITHVAISLGGPKIAHSSLANGGFALNTLDAPDPIATHLRQTFRFARRLF
jgi:gamma-D-glutamyl-L-lysine dipeptidyl-peptidase